MLFSPSIAGRDYSTINAELASNTQSKEVQKKTPLKTEYILNCVLKPDTIRIGSLFCQNVMNLKFTEEL